MLHRCFLLLPLFAFVGCGPPDFIPVHGIVTLDGKPVEGASVIFHRLDGQGESSVAGTDAEGRFELKTEEKAGAFLGRYEVAVRKVRTDGFPQIVVKPAEGEDAEGAGALSGFVGTETPEIWDIPKRYGDFATSELKVDITPEMGEVKLELKSPK